MFLKLSILLLIIVTALFGTSAPASAKAGRVPASGCSREGDGCEESPELTPAVARFASGKLKSRFWFLTTIDSAATKQFERAWYFSNAGTSGREGLVLVFREEGDSYSVKTMGFTGEYKRVTFRWNRSIIAVVHTHPNGVDPRPSRHDQLVAQEYGVPMFTITGQGMYAYDPGTNITIKIFSGLDWLDASKWTLDVYSKLIAGLSTDVSHRSPSAAAVATDKLRGRT